MPKSVNAPQSKDPHFDWPYATTYLLETLDPELIEAHAEHILSRSLNVGRCVGFIGAGVAMSYGRISWQTLVQTELKRVTTKLEEAKASSRWNESKADDAKRLWQTLDTLKISRTDIRSERYPMLFQVSEQLDHALNQFLDRPEDHEGVRAHATKLTIDDQGHAYQILLDALCYDQPVEGDKKATEVAARAFVKKILSGESYRLATDGGVVADLPTGFLQQPYSGQPAGTVGNPLDQSAYRLFFDTQYIFGSEASAAPASLMKIVWNEYSASDAPSFLQELDEAIKWACTQRPADPAFGGHSTGGGGAQERKFLLPTDRYLVGVLLHLCPREAERPDLRWRLPARSWWQKINETTCNEYHKQSKLSEAEKKAQPRIARATRHGLVTQGRDPLLFMQERLRINRFITTNFDHEIERLFKDQSFRNAGAPDKPESMLRPAFDAIVFDNNRSGDLTAFAVRDRSLRGAVVHLHGRADVEANEADSEIVVTETDYQKRYLRPDSNRKLVDDAIRLAFGSSPIVFVGSNMGEDDLLRPLRQFMSGPARVGDRVAVALVPAMNDRSKRTEEKIALLGRYGVYAIHFGNARFRAPSAPDGASVTFPGERPEFEWLPWYWSIQNSARDVLKFLSSDGIEISALRSEFEAADQAWNRIRKAYSNGLEVTPSSLTQIKDRLTAAGVVPGEKLDAEVENTLMLERDLVRDRLLDDEAAENKRLAFKLHSPCEIEDQTVATHKLDVAVEVILLNCALNWIGQNLPDSKAADVFPGFVFTSEEKKKKCFKDRQIAHALLLALIGAGDSLLSIATCARLIKTKRDWDEWKVNWFRPPKPAAPSNAITARETLAKTDLIAPKARIAHRHQINMPDRPGEDAAAGRFYRGAPSQTLFSLIETLEGEAAQPFREAKGRRFLLLCSRRGLGKGHFFSALEHCTGLFDGEEIQAGNGPRVFEFLRALAPGYSYAATQWVGLGFMSLSFSQEVMSAFDRVITLLQQCLEDVNPKIADSLRFGYLKMDRLEKLRAVLTAWGLHAMENPKDNRRVLIAFNGFSVLYDREGREKNGQVKRLCDLLYDEAYSAAPIDFVLLCRDNRLPLALIGPDSVQAPIALLPDANDAKARGRAERTLMSADIGPRASKRLARPGLEMSWHNTAYPERPDSWQTLRIRAPATEKKPDSGARTPAVAIHVLKEARAVVLAAAYFPRVGVFITRHLMLELVRSPVALENQKAPRPVPVSGTTQPKDDAPFDRRVLPPEDSTKKYGGKFETHSQSSRNAIREAFDAIQSATPRILPKHFAPSVLALITIIQEYSAPEGENPATDIIRKYHDSVLRAPERKLSDPENWSCLIAAKEVLDDHFKDARCPEFDGKPVKSLPDFLYNIFPKLVDKLNVYMRDIFQLMNGGRFLITLLFASAYEQTADLSDARRSLTIAEVDKAATDTITLLDNVKLALTGGHPSARANAVIEEVLSSMRRRADRAEQLPIQLDWTLDAASADGAVLPMKPTNSADGTWPEMKPALFKLMMEVIWHLAIVGQPVEIEVLECCPRILAICKSIADQNWGGGTCNARMCIERALSLALNRCLIYELCTNTRGDYENTNLKETGRNRRFTVHRLVQRYVFRSLGASSSEFPDADQFTLSFYASQPDDLPRLETDAHREISGVIAALSEYPIEPGGQIVRRAKPAGFDKLPVEEQQREHFSLRRQRLRASLGIMRSIYSVAVLSRFDRLPENNEALVQEGYFEEHRRRIRWLLKASSELTAEAPLESPFYAEEIVWLYNECAVLSTVEGRLSDAQALFTLALEAAKQIEPDETGPLHLRILLNRSFCDIERGHGNDARAVLEQIASVRNEHVVPPLIAKGYLGLIDHLAGEIAQAEIQYKAAIDGLSSINRSRSASIFSRHYGDMLGGLHQPRMEEGLQQIENALHFAQEGGHEDIRYLALLSLAKCHIRKPGEIDGASIHKELDAIEVYGRIVGMPRILCEVALTRARLLLRQGESERAGTLVNDSLEIASMNDMRLRKISGLLLLSEINLRRGQAKAARPLLGLGIRMAKALNSHFSLSHAQSLEHQLDAELSSSK